MSLDVQRLTLTNDHTLETASEVMSQLQFERRIPNERGKESYLQVLRNLGFRSEQNGAESYKQDVFQGQCLILGDARVGKTSLAKSLTGQAFNADEPATKGVETSLVDRKWKRLNADEGLKFGSFARFFESVLYQAVMFGPTGIEFIFDSEVTSAMSAMVHFMFMLLRIGWIISIIWLLAFATESVRFYAYSAAAFALEIFLQLQQSEHPECFKLALLLFTLPRILIGLGTAHVLAAIFREPDCQGLDLILFGESLFSDCEFMWVLHVGIVTMLLCDICSDLFITLKYYSNYFNANNWEGVESSVPGQVKFNNPVPFLPRFFLFMIPVIGGLSFGCVIQLHLSTNMATLNFCLILHFMVIPIVCLTAVRLTLALCAEWNLLGIGMILLFYVIGENIYVQFTQFCSLTTYLVFFAGFSCYILYINWNALFFIFNETLDARETRANFTFILIQKVVLNFEKLRRALHSTFSSLKLKIVDFSGDKEYYAYHHIFLRDNAIYLVLFNMTNFADDNMATKFQRLNFWLKSICSKASSKTPIFLVGTHRGRMKKSYVKEINKHLCQNLLYSFGDELVLNEEDSLLYFPVENTHGKNDKGIQNLQRRIIATAQEHKNSIGRAIPFSWIKIQDAVINLRQNKNAKFCVTLERFPISVGDFICSNWSKETLKYFHEKGLVIFVDHSELSKWVLLKPQILSDIIIQLVTPVTEDEVVAHHDFKKDFKLLHETGMLTEPLLNNILSRWKENQEAMRSFLEEYDIICPLFHNMENNKHERTVTHFVPSLLPLSVNMSTPVWHDDPTDRVFYVFFKRFLPEALFQHLLSRAHKSSKVEFPQGRPLIGKDVGRFWLRPDLPYRLLELKKDNMIEVTFTYRGRLLKPRDVLSQVFTMIQDICQRHFPYVKFHCGPACPSDRCPGHQDDYVYHPGVQRSHFRRHVFDVMPARQEYLDASFYCVNQNFEQHLEEWKL